MQTVIGTLEQKAATLEEGGGRVLIVGQWGLGGSVS